MKFSIKHMVLAGLLLSIPQLMNAAAAEDVLMSKVETAEKNLRELKFPAAAEWSCQDFAACWETITNYYDALKPWVQYPFIKSVPHKEFFQLVSFLKEITIACDICHNAQKGLWVPDDALAVAANTICREAKPIFIKLLKEKNAKGECKLEEVRGKISAGVAVEIPPYVTLNLSSALQGVAVNRRAQALLDFEIWEAAQHSR